MVDKLSCADLDESTAYIDKFSRGRFSDPEATEKTLQVMPGLPKTLLNLMTSFALTSR
jgi:hypothetical protein